MNFLFKLKLIIVLLIGVFFNCYGYVSRDFLQIPMPANTTPAQRAVIYAANLYRAGFSDAAVRIYTAILVAQASTSEVDEMGGELWRRATALNNVSPNTSSGYFLNSKLDSRMRFNDLRQYREIANSLWSVIGLHNQGHSSTNAQTNNNTQVSNGGGQNQSSQENQSNNNNNTNVENTDNGGNSSNDSSDNENHNGNSNNGDNGNHGQSNNSGSGNSQSNGNSNNGSNGSGNNNEDDESDDSEDSGNNGNNSNNGHHSGNDNENNSNNSDNGNHGQSNNSGSGNSQPNGNSNNGSHGSHAGH